MTDAILYVDQIWRDYQTTRRPLGTQRTVTNAEAAIMFLALSKAFNVAGLMEAAHNAKQYHDICVTKLIP